MLRLTRSDCPDIPLAPFDQYQRAFSQDFRDRHIKFVGQFYESREEYSRKLRQQANKTKSLEQHSSAAVFYDPPLFHGNDPVGKVDDFSVMRDHQCCRPARAAKSL